MGAGSYVLTYSYTDAFGCVGSDSATVEVVDCTSIQERSGNGRIAMYPNPFSNTVNLALDGNAGEGTATITDPQGKEIKTVIFDAASGNARLTLDRLEHGVHLVQVRVNVQLIAVNKAFKLNRSRTL